MVVHTVGDVADRVRHQQRRTEALQLPRLRDRTTVTFPPIEVAELLFDLGIRQCGHRASSLFVSLSSPAYPACPDDHTRATPVSHTNITPSPNSRTAPHSPAGLIHSVRPVSATLAPIPIMASPLVPPMAAIRRGERANHARTVPARAAQQLSSTSAVAGNNAPSINN